MNPTTTSVEPGGSRRSGLDPFQIWNTCLGVWFGKFKSGPVAEGSGAASSNAEPVLGVGETW